MGDVCDLAFSVRLPNGIQFSQAQDPCSVREAMAAPDADGWMEPMDREMENLRNHDVYDLVPCAPGMRTIRLDGSSTGSSRTTSHAETTSGRVSITASRSRVWSPCVLY